MLKNPYVSRAFGHLFDLVRLVMRSALPPTDLTAKTSTPSTPALTKAAGAAINEKRAQSGSFFDLSLIWKLFEKSFHTFKNFRAKNDGRDPSAQNFSTNWNLSIPITIKIFI